MHTPLTDAACGEVNPCHHPEINFGSGDYYIFCHGCNSKWVMSSHAISEGGIDSTTGQRVGGTPELANRQNPPFNPTIPRILPPEISARPYIVLGLKQKLAALAFKYYSRYQWEPKAGDYYTTCRDDLELYRVVDVTDTDIITNYCDASRSTGTSTWPRDEFLSPDTFGYARVYVPDWIFDKIN